MGRKNKKTTEQTPEAAPVVADVQPEQADLEDEAGETEDGQPKQPGKIHRAIAMLLKGATSRDVEVALSASGSFTADVHTKDGTAIVYQNKTGDASAKNAVRAARAALHALVALGVLDSQYTPKSAARPKMSDEERKAKAEAKRAKAKAEKAELEAFRAQVAEATKTA